MGKKPNPNAPWHSVAGAQRQVETDLGEGVLPELRWVLRTAERSAIEGPAQAARLRKLATLLTSMQKQGKKVHQLIGDLAVFDPDEQARVAQHTPITAALALLPPGAPTTPEALRALPAQAREQAQRVRGDADLLTATLSQLQAAVAAGLREFSPFDGWNEDAPDPPSPEKVQELRLLALAQELQRWAEMRNRALSGTNAAHIAIALEVEPPLKEDPQEDLTLHELRNRRRRAWDRRLTREAPTRKTPLEMRQGVPPPKEAAKHVRDHLHALVQAGRLDEVYALSERAGVMPEVHRLAEGLANGAEPADED